MNLTQLFDLSLQGRAAQPALEFQGVSYSFGDIEARANRTAHWLLDQGVSRGDRICVYLPNCLEIVDLFLACTRTGVIFVPVNILYRDREIQHILGDAKPSLFVNDCAMLADAAAKPSTRPALPALEGDDIAAIVYTSGTTGVSKGAMLTHNNFLANATNLVTCWQITSADRLLLPLPLFHVHGLGNGIPCWLATGFHVRLLERFEHSTATEQFLDYQPTLFFGVPTMYVRLLETAPEAARQIGARMRLWVSGSAPLPPQVLDDFQKLFGHTILERYGMTETLMNISNPYTGERRAGTVGFPLPGVSVRILDADGNDIAPDATGELHLKGPNLFAGYWGREQATRDAFRDGWFKTGDMGTRAEDGYITLQGRKSDLIISSGFNIYPREVEEFLLEQPEVAEAAVIGVPDPRKGEIPVAFIVPRPGASLDGLEERCRQNLASFKVPKQMVTVDKLPRTALGKVQKHILASQMP
ncbi:MAG: acyl-CoA synthetase [Bryobacterales bacterium]|nr:acyl-CoA synthetase [Bryobacterales bacterium]